MKALILFVTLAVAGVLLGADSPGKPKAAPVIVKIDNFSFTPETLTVEAGTTVTWINQDDVPHTVTSTDKRFKSPALDTDERFSHTFTVPGTNNYFCSVHPHMTGQVIVREAGIPPSSLGARTRPAQRQVTVEVESRLIVGQRVSSSSSTTPTSASGLSRIAPTPIISSGPICWLLTAVPEDFAVASIHSKWPFAGCCGCCDKHISTNIHGHFELSLLPLRKSHAC